MYVIIAILVIAFLFASKKKSSKRTKQKIGNPTVFKSGNKSVSLQLTMEIVRPDPAIWAREREEAKRKKAEEVEKIKSDFKGPATKEECLAGIESALNSLASAYGKYLPDISSAWQDALTEKTEKKIELRLRKRLNEEYKQRETGVEHLLSALVYCHLHARYVLENLNLPWKTFTGLKRLISNLNSEQYRSACIGLLQYTATAAQEKNPALTALCNDEADRLFRCWHGDIQANEYFENAVRSLSSAKTVDAEHFTLNGIVEYLARRVHLNPSLRTKLIEYCERDIPLYKPFIASFAVVDRKPLSFEAAVMRKNYFCPHLPSFNALWDLYESEGNEAELARLEKIGREIKHGWFAYEMERKTNVGPTPIPESFAKITEVIEIPKSGKKGKLAFFDSERNLCSTEEAVQDYYRQRGFKVVRGEFQFWQAMFGLSFWEEIYEGTDAPNQWQDIPPDLFSGADFYDNRKNGIELKKRFLESTKINDFIQSQLGKYGSTWTRIISDDGRRDFSYRTYLKTAEVADFLKIVNPVTFAKMVHRVALNPAENRAGPPDYMVWKDSEVFFVEVKGIREEIRESQIQWISWMHEQGIPVKIVRVKGVVESDDLAA